MSNASRHEAKLVCVEPESLVSAFKVGGASGLKKDFRRGMKMGSRPALVKRHGAGNSQGHAAQAEGVKRAVDRLSIEGCESTLDEAGCFHVVGNKSEFLHKGRRSAIVSICDQGRIALIWT